MLPFLSSIPNLQIFHFFLGRFSSAQTWILHKQHLTLSSSLWVSILLAQVPKVTALGHIKHIQTEYTENPHIQQCMRGRKEGEFVCLAHSRFLFLLVKMYPTGIISPTLLDCIFWPLEQLCGKPDTTFWGVVFHTFQKLWEEPESLGVQLIGQSLQQHPSQRATLNSLR